MNLKKIIPLVFMAMCISLVTPVFAGNTNPVAPTEKTNPDVRSQEMTNRLMEIKNMDKSNLTSSEKRELRKEVKKIKKANSRGIYLSLGAIVIIVLLLLLLL